MQKKIPKSRKTMETVRTSDYRLRFKGAAQTIQDQKFSFELGDEVEVTERLGDFVFCLYPGVITKIDSARAHTKAYTLKKTDWEALMESVDIKSIKPKAIEIVFKFKQRDYVDVWITDR
ncbi:hypothetical protein LXL04_031094 [Taraxacum kok-saghyz]